MARKASTAAIVSAPVAAATVLAPPPARPAKAVREARIDNTVATIAIPGSEQYLAVRHTTGTKPGSAKRNYVVKIDPSMEGYKTPSGKRETYLGYYAEVFKDFQLFCSPAFAQAVNGARKAGLSDYGAK